MSCGWTGCCDMSCGCTGCCDMNCGCTDCCDKICGSITWGCSDCCTTGWCGVCWTIAGATVPFFPRLVTTVRKTCMKHDEQKTDCKIPGRDTGGVARWSSSLPPSPLCSPSTSIFSGFSRSFLASFSAASAILLKLLTWALASATSFFHRLSASFFSAALSFAILAIAAFNSAIWAFMSLSALGALAWFLFLAATLACVFCFTTSSSELSSSSSSSSSSLSSWSPSSSSLLKSTSSFFGLFLSVVTNLGLPSFVSAWLSSELSRADTVTFPLRTCNLVLSHKWDSSNKR